LEVAKVDARRGADVLLEVLESEGVQYIFGNPGTTELPLYPRVTGLQESERHRGKAPRIVPPSQDLQRKQPTQTNGFPKAARGVVPGFFRPPPPPPLGRIPVRAAFSSTSDVFRAR
jgi:hypothetical protein